MLHSGMIAGDVISWNWVGGEKIKKVIEVDT